MACLYPLYTYPAKDYGRSKARFDRDEAERRERQANMLTREAEQRARLDEWDRYEAMMERVEEEACLLQEKERRRMEKKERRAKRVERFKKAFAWLWCF